MLPIKLDTPKALSTGCVRARLCRYEECSGLQDGTQRLQEDTRQETIALFGNLWTKMQTDAVTFDRVTTEEAVSSDPPSFRQMECAVN